MIVTLEKVSCEITDDTAWTKERVGLSNGDIYLDDNPFGHYVAAWYPDSNKPLQMIVTVIDDAFKPQLSVGFHCPKGSPDALSAVEPVEIPWQYDGILFGPIVTLQEIISYSLAKQALIVAPEIIRQDDSLRKYIYEFLHAKCQ